MTDPTPSTDALGGITHEEAQTSALRFINAHFRNPPDGSLERERPVASIPANADRDTDLRLMAYLRAVPAIVAHARELESERDRAVRFAKDRDGRLADAGRGNERLAAEGGPVIKELRAKLEAATPGPWAHTRPTEPDVGDEDVRVCYLRDGVHCEWCIALAGESVDGAGERWTKETLDRWHADAALIAAARNALPALLAVVEAALERDGCSEVCSAMKPYRGCTCGAEALDRALASLTRNDEVDRG